jgi:hypothetical protein
MMPEADQTYGAGNRACGVIHRAFDYRPLAVADILPNCKMEASSLAGIFSLSSSIMLNVARPAPQMLHSTNLLTVRSWSGPKTIVQIR